MKLYSILGNSQKLDGGAMYGNCPKALWSKWSDPDCQNRIQLACRALLIDNNGEKILIETGIGAYMSKTLKDRFGVLEEEHVLIQQLANINILPEDISCVILSHLHFDHAGGILSSYEEGKPLNLIFKNASYFVSEKAFERASKPHFRDKASFIPELTELLLRSNKLNLIGSNCHDKLPNYLRFHFSDGHTPGLLITEIKSEIKPEESIFFVSDLIPAVPWVNLPITMGYDRYPELLIEEKGTLLELVNKNNSYLFYTHDPIVSMSKVRKNNLGKFEAFDCHQILSGFEFK